MIGWGNGVIYVVPASMKLVMVILGFPIALLRIMMVVEYDWRWCLYVHLWLTVHFAMVVMERLQP